MGRAATPRPPEAASVAASVRREDLRAAPSPALAAPPGNPRFPLFDGLRGIAVLGVLFFHVSEMTGRVGIGALGRVAEVAGAEVPILFFGISGFLLYRPYVAARATGRSAPATSRYARRRALRILPGYWTILTLLAIFPGLPGVFSGQWWRYYGYLQIYTDRTLGQGIAVAWTLCVEVTFYILLPLWAWGIRSVGGPHAGRRLLAGELVPLAVAAGAGVGVQLAAARRAIPYVVGVAISGQVTWLAIGMALAVLSVAVQAEPGRLRWLQRLADRSELCWAGAALAWVGLAAIVPAGGLFGLIAEARTVQPLGRTVIKFALEGTAMALLVLPAVFGRRERDLPRRLLAWRPLVWLGVISYSFYLWHLTVVELIAHSQLPGGSSDRGLDLVAHLHFAPTLILYVIGLAATAALATITYQLVELPFLRRKESPYPRVR